MTSTLCQPSSSYLLALDIETSGPSMVHHFIPCFGAALIDVNTLRPVTTRLFWIQQPENTTWDTATVKAFWQKSEIAPWYAEILERQRSKTLPSLKDTMNAFVNWVREIVGYSPPHSPSNLHSSSSEGIDNNIRPYVRIVSDNPAFDLGWLSYYLALGTDGRVPQVQYLLHDRFNGPPLDTKSFFDGICRRLRIPLFNTADYWQPPASTWHTLGISRWRRNVLDANNAHHDHHPHHDAVVIGLNVAIAMNAAADSCRKNDKVPLRSRFDHSNNSNNSNNNNNNNKTKAVVPASSPRQNGKVHQHQHHHNPVQHQRSYVPKVNSFYSSSPPQQPIVQIPYYDQSNLQPIPPLSQTNNIQVVPTFYHHTSYK